MTQEEKTSLCENIVKKRHLFLQGESQTIQHIREMETAVRNLQLLFWRTDAQGRGTRLHYIVYFYLTIRF